MKETVTVGSQYTQDGIAELRNGGVDVIVFVSVSENLGR